MSVAAGAARLTSFLRGRPWHAALAALASGLACAEAPPGLLAAAAALLLLGLAWLRAPWLGVGCAALLLSASLLGQARLTAIDGPGRGLPAGSPVSARADLLERPRPERFGSSALVRVTSGPGRGARLLARAGADLRWPPGVGVGSELRLRGVVGRPRARRGARFDYASYLEHRGVAGELSLSALAPSGGRRGGLAAGFDRARSRAESALTAGLPGDQAALLLGMVLGEDERVAAATRDDWRASGLAHLLSVSGQNVMLLAALAAPLMVAFGLSPPARAAALVCLIACYVPLAGAGPSIQRAGVMGAAGAVALAVSRPASRSYALLLAAAVTLALNPRVWGDVGWQLSFAAVAGIVWLAAPLRRALAGGRRGPRLLLAEGVALTLTASLATAPLLAHHFGSAPLATLPANLLALPAVPPAMWLGMLKAAVGQVPALAPGLAEPAASIAHVLGLAARLPLGYLNGLAEHFAALPIPRLGPPLGSGWAVAAAYVALVAALLGARALAQRGAARADRLGARWRELPSRSRAPLLATSLTLVALLVVRWLTLPGPPTGLTVSFLDVGQGDATLVQAPGGVAVLFDGGPPEAGVMRLLRRAGVRRLAVVVATHASRDHHGGLQQVLRRLPVGLLLDGGDGTRDPSFRALEREADARGVRRLRATAPLSLYVGGLSLRVLSPSRRPPGPPPEDPNRRAVVALVGAGEFKLLLSADAESDALSPLVLPDVDALKVPHHGSRDPGLPALIARLRPEVAAIEVGRDNVYGHPAPSTLAALRGAAIPTYRTDRDGTIKLTPEHGRLSVTTER